MGTYQKLDQHINRGICSVNGNILTGWKVPFGMPYLPWDNGGAGWTYANGAVATRYCDMTNSSVSLSGLYHGMEVIMSDLLIGYCVTDGSVLCGCGRYYWDIISPTSVCTAWASGIYFPINITAPSSGYTWQAYQHLGVAGIDQYDEFHTNGTLCFRACVTCVSGDNLSQGPSTVCLTASNTPTLCDRGICGAMWVDGVNLHYTGARGWEHFLCGDCCGCSIAGGCPGAVWIEGNNLHWIGSDGTTAHQNPWAFCQYATSFANGPGANPNPGALYAGAIWTDQENWGGWVELAFIGTSGAKYLLGNGNRPDQVPS